MKHPRPLKGAWLITWEWIGDHARVEQPIAAVLNYRRSGEQVRQFVEQLYCALQYGMEEKVRVARDMRRNPYPAKFGQIKGVRFQGEVTCGHNPWLRARLVRNLRAIALEDGSERLEFEEMPRVLPR